MSNFENIVWSPEEYRQVSVVAEEVGKEMLGRLDWLTIKPQHVLDIGCGLGEHAQALAERYPKAQIIAMDNDMSMLQYAKQVEQPNLHYICGHSAKLGLPSQSVDLVFANLLTPWQEDIETHLREWRRVLRPFGVLLFSALGPDTLRECREILPTSEQPYFRDMHEIGDQLVNAGFSEPVLDIDYLTLTYTQPKKLLDELLQSNMWMPMTVPDISLPKEDIYPITYEVVYAHAFVPTSHQRTVGGVKEVSISLHHLRQQWHQVKLAHAKEQEDIE